MKKNQFEKIVEVNELLAEKFGMPARPKILPNPLDMLIATILSQNTNDNNSYKAFENLKRKFKSWEEAAVARRSLIEKEIKIAGLGLQKSAAIKNVLTQLNKSRAGLSLDHLKNYQCDDAIKELTGYKGVGVKTASCVLLFSLGKNICPVDTHVHRTVNRIGIVQGSTPDKTFFKLNENFPPKIAHQFHTNLIRLGREICLPRNPACGICPLKKICKYDSKILDNRKSSAEKSFMLLDNVK
jgi:endonuclease-3